MYPQHRGIARLKLTMSSTDRGSSSGRVGGSLQFKPGRYSNSASKDRAALLALQDVSASEFSSSDSAGVPAREVSEWCSRRHFEFSEFGHYRSPRTPQRGGDRPDVRHGRSARGFHRGSDSEEYRHERLCPSSVSPRRMVYRSRSRESRSIDRRRHRRVSSPPLSPRHVRGVSKGEFSSVWGGSPLTRHSSYCSPPPRPSSTHDAEQEPIDRAIAEEPSVAPEIVACVKEAWRIVLARLPSKHLSFQRAQPRRVGITAAASEERSVNAKRPITWLWMKAINQLDEALDRGAATRCVIPPAAVQHSTPAYTSATRLWQSPLLGQHAYGHRSGPLDVRQPARNQPPPTAMGYSP